MKQSNGSLGFWKNGRHTFLEELAKKRRETLAPLETELESSVDPVRKAELTKQIRDIQARFEEQAKDAQYSLF